MWIIYQNIYSQSWQKGNHENARKCPLKKFMNLAFDTEKLHVYLGGFFNELTNIFDIQILDIIWVTSPKDHPI